MAGGKRLAALDRAVGNGDRGGLLCAEVSGAEFNHFACAHVKDALLFKRSEKAHGKPDGRCGKAHRIGADGGVRTDVFGGCECFLKEVIEHEPEGFVFPGGCNGLFKLSHDLGFTEHHGVNAADHAENVAGGIALRVAVKVRLKLRKRHRFGFGNKVRERLSGLFCVFCSAVDFGAVAGRKNHRFGQSALTAAGEPVAQRMKAGPDFIGAERNAFTHRKRCCGVIQAKTKQLHECSSVFCLRRLGFRQAKLYRFFHGAGIIRAETFGKT